MSEPPVGIEPMTYALRGACSSAAHALAAPIARAIALMAFAARDYPATRSTTRSAFKALRLRILLLYVNVADDMRPRPQADTAPRAEG